MPKSTSITVFERQYPFSSSWAISNGPSDANIKCQCGHTSRIELGELPPECYRESKPQNLLMQHTRAGCQPNKRELAAWQDRAAQTPIWHQFCYSRHLPGDCAMERQHKEIAKRSAQRRATIEANQVKINGRWQCPGGCDLAVGGCIVHSDRC